MAKIVLQSASTGNSITVVTPIFDYLKYGNYNFTVNVHAYNVSNGVRLNNKSTDCFLHIYDKFGVHIIVSEMVYSFDEDYEYTIPIGNFSDLDTISMLVDCNSSSTDGFLAANIDLNYTGMQDISWLPIIFGIALLNVIFFCLMMWAKDNMEFLAHFFFLLLIWTITITTNILWRFAFEHQFTLQFFLLAFYRIMLIIAALMSLIMLVLLTIDVIKIRKINGNPVDNYRDNLDNDDKKNMF